MVMSKIKLPEVMEDRNDGISSRRAILLIGTIDRDQFHSSTRRHFMYKSESMGARYGHIKKAHFPEIKYTTRPSRDEKKQREGEELENEKKEE